MNLQDQEENLLDEILMANHSSCPNPDFSGQFTIDQSEGHSLTVELEEEFKLSSNEDENEKPLLHDLTYGQASFDTRPVTYCKMVHSTNQTSKKRMGSYKKESRNQMKKEKRWDKMSKLDSRLIELHYSGLLDESEVLSRVEELVLTEQYCKMKVYERMFMQSLKQIDFSLQESEKQKKSLISQINLLKNDNEALRSTIDELQQIIKDLEVTIETYFKSMNRKKTNLTHTHSQDENKLKEDGHFESFLINSSQIDGEEGKRDPEIIRIEDFSQFVLQLQKKTANIINNSGEFVQAKLYLPIVDQFHKQSAVRDCIIDIVGNLHQLENNTFSQFTFGSSFINPSTTEERPIERLLKMFKNNRDHFAEKIKKHENGQLQFWFIIHSTVITFIGVLFSQKIDYSLEMSFEGTVRSWTTAFAESLEDLRETGRISLDLQKERYWYKMINLIRRIRSRQ